MKEDWYSKEIWAQISLHFGYTMNMLYVFSKHFVNRIRTNSVVRCIWIYVQMQALKNIKKTTFTVNIIHERYSYYRKTNRFR